MVLLNSISRTSEGKQFLKLIASNPYGFVRSARYLTGNSRRRRRDATEEIADEPKTDEDRNNSIRILGGIFAISAGIGLGAGLIKAIFANSSLGSNSLPQTDVRPSISRNSYISSLPNLAANNVNFVADVVDKISPSVVYLEVAGRNYVPLVGELVNVSNGSGFIISSDGLILTNAHVVGGHAEKGKVKVKLHNEKIYDGVVETVATNSDLATVRIKAKNLPVMKLAEKETRLGEFVVAAGSPLFLSNSVSFGIVSGLKRNIEKLGKSDTQQEMEDRGIAGLIRKSLSGSRKRTQYIQTDAAINSGNSGGPLVNMCGEVVGVCNMTVGSAGAILGGPIPSGISFAIPVSDVKNFIESPAFKAAQSRFEGKSGTQLKSSEENKKAAQRYLGIQMTTLSPEILEDLQFYNFDFPSVSQGALVSGVYIGSPAYESGIRPGDIISKVNETPITGAGDVLSIVDQSETLNIVILRGNTELEFKIRTEEILPQ